MKTKNYFGLLVVLELLLTLTYQLHSQLTATVCEWKSCDCDQTSRNLLQVMKFYLCSLIH